jgi:hypothetical protein
MDKITQWFPPSIKPVHKGIYETRIKDWYSPGATSKWNGKRWSTQRSENSSEKYLDEGDFGILADQDKSWRGLARKR